MVSTRDLQFKSFSVVGHGQAVLFVLEVEVSLILVVAGQLLVGVLVGVELQVTDALHQGG